METGVVRFQLKPGTARDFREKWDQWVLKVRQASGYVQSILMIDPQSNECLSLGVWESKEEADAFGRGDLYASFLSQVSDMMARQPQRQEYECAVDLSDAELAVLEAKPGDIY